LGDDRLGGADFPLARTGGGFSVPIEKATWADGLKRLMTKETLTSDAESALIRRRKPGVTDLRIPQKLR
jgi:hypothetical protein